MSYDIYPSLSDLLHSVGQSLGPSILMQMGLFNSFQWLGNIPLYTCNTFLLSIPLLMDIQVVYMTWLLQSVPQWILGCMYSFKPCFAQDLCPGVGLQGHMVVLFLIFFFFFLQLLSFISPPCKGQFEFSSIPLLSPSPPSDQILQAADPG